jgi:hypothetical protein
MEAEAEVIPKIEAVMTKKDEGRPITPEEYRELHYFNTRVESAVAEEQRELAKRRQERIKAAKAAVPADAYELPLMTLGLPTKVENLLLEEGFDTVGKLAYQLLLIPESISDIDGIGPTYIEEIEKALDVMVGYEPLPEELDVDMSQFGEDVAIPIPEPPAEEKEDQEVQEAEAEEAEQEAPPDEELDEKAEEAEGEADAESAVEAEEGEAEVVEPEAEEDVIPADAYDLPVMTLGLPEKVENLLTEAGMENVGQLAAKFQQSPDEIQAIEGIDPDAREEILTALEVMVGFKPQPKQVERETAETDTAGES